MLTLGPQEGLFPWGFDLEGTPGLAGPADTLGTAYTVDCGEVQLTYCVKDGIETLYAMETSLPYLEADGLYCTPRGLYCGYDEQDVAWMYRHAVKLEDFEDPDYDSCWVYEIYAKHIAAYCRDGAVEMLHIENLVDDQLLNH